MYSKICTMEKKILKEVNGIENEMQKLRSDFLMLKKKREELQQKIDAYKQKSF